jgi:hypothetical protein
VIQRIRTPEAIFREEKKDIFALKFKERNEKQQFDTLKKMEQWVALQLKESKTEVIGPPEASPYIEGGPKMLRIDFSNEDLKIFMDTWKEIDGQSVDPRFQCCLLSYSEWLSTQKKYSPTFERPKAPGVGLWIETKMGILAHVIEGHVLRQHPSSYENLWHLACLTWPELKVSAISNHHHGSVIWSQHEDQYCLLVNSAKSGGPSNLMKKWQQIGQWLMLPQGFKVEQEDFF